MLSKKTILEVAQQCYAASDRDRAKEDNLFGDHDPVSPKVHENRYMTWHDFEKAVRWKSERAWGRAKRNTEDKVRESTEAAFAEASASRAIKILSEDKAMRLEGVGVPVASALLTVYDPDNYTVMDWRAWASLIDIGLLSLGLTPAMAMGPHTPNTYAAYLAACRKLARQYGVGLRDLDRCLWVLKGRTVEKMEYDECPRRPQGRCRKRDGQGER
jgi:hypothetical protein